MKPREIVAVLVAIAIWTVAGYLTGEAKGRGWRGAMIRAGANSCTLAER